MTGLATIPIVADAVTLVEPSLRLARPVPDGPAVALTLDACPGGFDVRIADALIAERIPATIFLTALWIERNPDALARLRTHRDLFRFENHGARHIPAILGGVSVYGLRAAGTLAAVRAEVSDGAAAVRKATGEAPIWYRDATARYSAEALSVIRGMGFGVAGYSLNADMGASLPASAVAARTRLARDGDVILGHINQPHRPSGRGIVAGVRALKDRGMRFVRLEPPRIDPDTGARP